MPDYNVYFFIVKPTLVPEREGASGTSTTLSDSDTYVEAARTEVLGIFTETLQTLMQAAVEHIPGSHHDYTVQVRQIPPASPGVPDFTGLTVAMHEPIVYLTKKEAETNPADPVDRRASLVMLRALEDGNFQEFPSANVRAWRDRITGNTGDLEGSALHVSDLAPAVAEIFSNVRMQYDADNWKIIQGNLLARAAYHEIAHCKVECENRASGSRWQPAISGSIHDQGGASILTSPLGWSVTQSNADKQLMGRHMLCPIAFYKLDQDVASQCFHHGTLTPPTPR
jgi:hypothetical protein